MMDFFESLESIRQLEAPTPPEPIARALAADLELVQKVLDYINAQLQEAAKLENPTPQQRMAAVKAKMEAAKLAEQERWLVTMERGLVASSGCSMGAVYRSIFSKSLY